MATAEAPARPHDRDGRRRPFSSWVRRLANLKSSSDSHGSRWSQKRSTVHKGKKGSTSKSALYAVAASDGQHGSALISQSDPSLAGPTLDNRSKSTAPTISTNGDTYSKAGTSATVGGGISSMGGGEGSTFSSPAPSVRSLTTTLTTVQSAAPSTQLYATQNASSGHAQPVHPQNASVQQAQFSHQFPPSPVSAVPPHMAPLTHSVTYSSATANNLLTDNASIVTLASSSKRRRRNSLDTNASIRALAPSSLFGGSRESLPLSVLSGSAAEPSNASVFNASGGLSRPSLAGMAGAERSSIYSTSTSGINPLGGAGERNSIYANKQTSAADGASIGSGVYSHVRNDSTTGSVSGGMGPTFTSSGVAQSMTTGRISRRGSGWGEIPGEASEEESESDRREEATEEKEELKTSDLVVHSIETRDDGGGKSDKEAAS